MIDLRRALREKFDCELDAWGIRDTLEMLVSEINRELEELRRDHRAALAHDITRALDALDDDALEAAGTALLAEWQRRQHAAAHAAVTPEALAAARGECVPSTTQEVLPVVHDPDYEPIPGDILRGD